MIWSLLHRERSLHRFWIGLLVALAIRILVWHVDQNESATLSEEELSMGLRLFRFLLLLITLCILLMRRSRLYISPFECSLPIGTRSLWLVRMSAVTISWLVPIMIIGFPTSPFLLNRPYLMALFEVIVGGWGIMWVLRAINRDYWRVKMGTAGRLLVFVLMYFVFGIYSMFVAPALLVVIGVFGLLVIGNDLLFLPRAPQITRTNPDHSVRSRSSANSLEPRLSVMPKQPYRFLPRKPDMMINTSHPGRPLSPPDRAHDLNWAPLADLKRDFSLRAMERIILGKQTGTLWLNMMCLFSVGVWIPFLNYSTSVICHALITLLLVVTSMISIIALENLSLLAPLPVSRRWMFTWSVAPCLLAVGLGLGTGGILVSITENHPVALRYLRNELRVPKESWRIVDRDEVQAVTAPWGESIEPEIHAVWPGSDTVAFNPFAADTSCSDAFFVWQEERAVIAIYGEVPGGEIGEIKDATIARAAADRRVRGELLPALKRYADRTGLRNAPLIAMRFVITFLLMIFIATRCLDRSQRWWRYRRFILTTLGILLYVALYLSLAFRMSVSPFPGLETYLSHITRDVMLAIAIPTWVWWCFTLSLAGVGLFILERLYSRMEVQPARSFMEKGFASHFTLTGGIPHDLDAD
ncbi:MAG: hypothetical protein GY835_11000 [bacterium]|nr:hypothetical protein [bacterium]